MRLPLLAFAGLLALATASSHDKKVVCYFGSWAVYRPGQGRFDIDQIDPNLCTHVVYAFVGLNEDGTVRILDPWADLPTDGGKDGFRKFNALRERNPHLKTMISMGGWNEGERNAMYSKVMASPALRSALVSSIVDFVTEHNFDGFDFDWEYPGPVRPGGRPQDKTNNVLFLKELSEAFKPRGLVMGAAVGASPKTAETAYDIPGMSKYLDFINLMEYDFHGTWESKTGHNAPTYPGSWETDEDAKIFNVDASIRYWLEQGAPAHKLLLGIPFYARGFTLANSHDNEVDASTRGGSSAGPYTRQAGTLGYNEICEQMDRWNVIFDEEQRVPYAYNGNQWISFDNELSIAEKGEYVIKHGLGGMMVWSLETDDFRGVCGDETYPLLRTVNKALDRRSGVNYSDGQKSPSNERPTPKPRPSTTQRPSTTTRLPLTSSSEIVCATNFAYMRDPNDCSVFYQCAHGIPHAKQCPHGLAFDEKHTRCDYKRKVKC